MEIDLNSKSDFNGIGVKYLFDNPMKVCRGTNMAFSAADVNGTNRVKCAFLG
jgi:hypothetical protein